jgi:hypothetical protein
MGFWAQTPIRRPNSLKIFFFNTTQDLATFHSSLAWPNNNFSWKRVSCVDFIGGWKKRSLTVWDTLWVEHISFRLFGTFFFKCRRENIFGGTELPVTPAIASNYERLPAKFGDDRNIFEEFSSFSPKHWWWAETYMTLKIFDQALWNFFSLENGE